jgi:SAM-dependent methyltransferase
VELLRVNTIPISSHLDRRQDFLTWAINGLRCRVARNFVSPLRHFLRLILGIREVQWGRVVMDRETDQFVRSLNYSSFHALEISGTKWEQFGFAAYRSIDFPEYDICERVVENGAFDIVIAEQVLEHVVWPYRAVRNIYTMLRPGGVFVVTTPFLIRVHNHPVDCSRWTELGIKYLLAEAGFSLANISTGSWGNRSCVRANFCKWALWVPWKHSLRNEPEFPYVVWAFARKA